MDPTWRHDAEASVADALGSLLPNTPCRVGSFLSIGSELNLEHFHQSIWASDHALYVPKIRSDTEMDWVALPDPSAIVPGRFGIPTSIHEEGVRASGLSVVIIPMVGFTRTGSRLGMGGGFYDRALAGAPLGSPMRIGVAFSGQELAELEVEPWDQGVEWIVTEREIIRP